MTAVFSVKPEKHCLIDTNLCRIYLSLHFMRALFVMKVVNLLLIALLHFGKYDSLKNRFGNRFGGLYAKFTQSSLKNTKPTEVGLHNCLTISWCG